MNKKKVCEFSSSTKKYSYLKINNVVDCLNHFKSLKCENLKIVKWSILVNLNRKLLNYWVT